MYVCMCVCFCKFAFRYKSYKDLHKIAVALHVISSRWYIQTQTRLMEVMQECGLGTQQKIKLGEKNWKSHYRIIN